jgi:hypothetical protein
MKVIHAAHGCCGGEKGSHGMQHHACCGITRRYITKEERREALESYREDLKKELQGVEERLAELK